MDTDSQIKNKDCFPELGGVTRKVIGVLFDVYNELGYGYQEKLYYNAIKVRLLEKGLKVQEQLFCKIMAFGKPIGHFYLDFLIDDSVVLELKVANGVYAKHIKQVLNYLKANNLKLGIIGVFTKTGVEIKRVAN